MNVLITGGTGHLGRLVIPRAQAAGHAVSIASRRSRPSNAAEDVRWSIVDLATGAGLTAALDGIDAIVHAASDLKNTDDADVEGTTRLGEAARDAGVEHLLFVSIVGIDRIPYPYYQRKLEAERRLVATAALAALFEECRRREVLAVHVEVGQDNDAARMLYERFGLALRSDNRLIQTVRLQEA